MHFLNVELTDVTVNIYDTLSGQGTTTFQPIEGSDDPLHIFIVDNDEEKFTPIRAKQAEIRFLSTAQVNLNNFIASQDNRWYVEIFEGLRYAFKGFLILDDTDEDFLDSDTANVVKLVATDNIGTLKDAPLTKPDGYAFSAAINTESIGSNGIIGFDVAGIDVTAFPAGATITIGNAGNANGTYVINGTSVSGGRIGVFIQQTIPNGFFANATLYVNVAGANPRGYYNLITYISWCLQKTGLQLPINVVHNVREEHVPSGIMYQTCFLSAKTFEAEINESVDCYQVLESILGNDCFLTQSGGEWWIIRVDDLQSNATIATGFSYSGIIIAQAPIDLQLAFNPQGNIYFSNLSTFVKVNGAVRSTKLTYRYEYPKEIVDNLDYSRGGLIQDLGDVKRYAFDDWTFGRLAGQPTGGAPYIYRRFTDGYEKERYVIFPQGSGESFNFIRCNAIPVEARDRFKFSLQWKLSTNITVGGNRSNYDWAVGMIRLRGTSGTVYVLAAERVAYVDSPVWLTSSGNPITDISNQGFFNAIWAPASINEAYEWQSVSVNITALPEDGFLEIYLFDFYHGVFRNREVHYSNISLDYEAFVNGSYAKYSGQYNRISQNLATKKAIDETVTISDSPKKLFKGALHYYNGTAYTLTGLFYDGRQYGTNPPPFGYRKPFGRNQADAVWNQSNRPFRCFDFNAQGLNAGGLFPEIIIKYGVSDPSPHTTNKVFMMLHYDLDMKLCEWKGYMTEVFDSTIPKDYASPYEFKYISGD